MKQKYREYTVRTFGTTSLLTIVTAGLSVVTKDPTIIAASEVLAGISLLLILFMYYVSTRK